MVSKAAVIGMLRYGHQLYRVVSCSFDSWQYLIPELVVSMNPGFLSCHSDMRLIDQGSLVHRLKIMPEMIGFLGCPNLRIENIGLRILHHSFCPGRYSFAGSVMPVYGQCIE